MVGIEGIYVLTDNSFRERSHVDVARAALEGGARLIQLRDKHATARHLVDCAKEIRALTQDASSLFFINDRLDVALAVDADGVHIGVDDMSLPLVRKLLGESKIIGCSVACADEARVAEQTGADYVSVGSIFKTSTKLDAGAPIGPGAIRAVKSAVMVPVVAIGGITKANIASVFEAGADAASLISAVADADDMVAATSELVKVWEANRNH